MYVTQKRYLQPFKEAVEKKTFLHSHPHLPNAQSRFEHATLLLEATKAQGLATMQRMAAVMQKEYDSVTGPIGAGSSSDPTGAASFASTQAKLQRYSNIVYMILLAVLCYYFYVRK